MGPSTARIGPPATDPPIAEIEPICETVAEFRACETPTPDLKADRLLGAPGPPSMAAGWSLTRHCSASRASSSPGFKTADLPLRILNSNQILDCHRIYTVRNPETWGTRLPPDLGMTPQPLPASTRAFEWPSLIALCDTITD